MLKNQKHWLAYSGLGMQMVIMIMICLWIGKKIEEFLFLPYPFGQLGGIFFGIFASLYNLIKSVKRILV